MNYQNHLGIVALSEADLSLLGKSLAAARVLGLSVARAGALLVRRYS